MEGTTALTVPPAAQTASAPVTHTPSAVPAHVAQAAPAVPTSSPAPAAPAHIVQAAPPAQTSAPASPAPGVTTPKTVAPTAPASSPAVDDPVQDEAGDEAVDDNAPTPAPIDTEVEAKLSAEITVLWATQKDNKATVRRTRAQLKELRLELGAKLHTMKTILARTGRGGGWAAYIRSQKLPLTTVDRYVAQHEAALAPRAEKLPTGEFSKIDEVRQLAKNMLPKVSRLLTSQELVYEFMHTLIWGIDVAEMSYTDAGFEIPKVGSDDAPEADMQAAELANPAPVAP